MIVAGSWRLLAGPRGWGWIRHSRAVLPVVARQVGTEGVAGGELLGGGGPGSFWGFWLWWFPSGSEVLGGSVGSWGGGWKHRRGLGALALAVFCRSEVAADPAGVGEESGPWPTGEGESFLRLA